MTQMLYVTAKLGLADHLRDTAMSVETLAKLIDADVTALSRLMHGLVQLGVLRREEHGRFGLTSLGTHLAGDVAGSSRTFAITLGEDMYSAYESLLHTVKTGESAFAHTHGMSYYEYLAQKPEAVHLFSQWIDRTARAWVLPFVASYDWKGIGRVVDLGGADGALLSAILKANPAMHGVLFDLPQLAERAYPVLDAAGVLERCEIIAGDFLEAVPPGGGLYILARVILNWDDRQAVTILENCRRVMTENGRLVIIDFVASDDGTETANLLNDINLMVVFGGARQRTEMEFRELVAAAGMRVTRMMQLDSSPLLRILEAVP